MTSRRDAGTEIAAGAEHHRVEPRAIEELRPHPEHAVLPMPSEADYAALRDDIGVRGVLDPLRVNKAGMVLDGHARLRAAAELGLTVVPVCQVAVDASDEVAFMLRAALLRRQLDASQRTALALLLVPYDQLREQAETRQHANLRQNAERAPLPTRNERTRALVAGLAGTSERTAQDVITVHENDSELFERILNGEIKAATAASKVRRARRDASIAPPPPMPDGPFPLILADPPWPSTSPDSGSTPEQHYPTMPIDELKALRLPAAHDCVLFLWIVDWRFHEAIELLKAWGFQFKASLIWVKPSIGPGIWVRHRHETCLLAIKGNASPPDPEDRCDSVIEAPRGRHSEKPEELYRRIERMYPDLPKLELFARGTPRPGWAAWGNQVTTTEADHSDGLANGEPE